VATTRYDTAGVGYTLELARLLLRRLWLVGGESAGVAECSAPLLCRWAPVRVKSKASRNGAFGASCPSPPFTRANVQILQMDDVIEEIEIPGHKDVPVAIPAERVVCEGKNYPTTMCY
jgi:hypothetical protein